MFSLHVCRDERRYQIALVANVASEIGIVAKEGDGDWEIIEIPEGSNVIMPLSGDEFTFPTGLAVVRSCYGVRQRIVHSTRRRQMDRYQDSTLYMKRTHPCLQHQVLPSGSAHTSVEETFRLKST
jgi:hypothetical protein